MTLQSGKYIVSNKAAALYLGRSINELADLRPKPIVTLSSGIQAPIWKVERLYDGRYKLAVSKPPGQESYVADIKGKVDAIFDPKDPVKPTEWTIKPIAGHGANVYLVETPSGKVWSVPDKNADTQVILDTLVVLASTQDEISLPHSPNQLFTFDPVLEDKDD
ncbi:hypothetical protein JOM56_009284 [Amanita muscaria]